MLVRLLGLVGVDADGRPPARLSSAQAQVTLARLALERERGTSRDTLADTLWPGGVPETWASAQRSVVTRVRRFLRDSGVAGADVTSLNGRYLLQLPADVAVDVEHAARLGRAAETAYEAGELRGCLSRAREAATLLQQPFLPEHEGEWVARTRERLADDLVVVLELAGHAARLVGQSSAAIDAAREAVRRSPLRESAHRCLIQAYAADSNRADALLAYETLRQALASELGIDPSTESLALYAELLGRAESADPSPRVPAPRTPLVEPSSSFVGRRRELAAIASAWRRACQENARSLVLVTGEPGSGKSQLLSEAVVRLAADQVVLFGRGPGPSRGSQLSPAGQFAPLLDALLEHREHTARQLPALARAVELVRQLAADPEAAEALLPEVTRAGQQALTEVSTDTPVLLVLDDIGECPATWSVLGRALEAASGSGLLVVATAGRVTEPDCDRQIRRLEHTGQLERLPLRGLGQSEIFRLVSLTVSDIEARSRVRTHQLHRDTGGNPFLLGELVRLHQISGADVHDIPPAVVEYAGLRQRDLDEDSIVLLRVAALAGDSFELDLLAEAAPMPLERAIDALDNLLDHGLVEEIADGRAAHAYQFRHQLLRRAFCGTLNAPRRQLIHARLADVIEQRRSTELQRYVHEVARHRSLAAPSDANGEAVRSIWRAAKHATADGALSDAVRLYGQALDHVPDTDLAMRAEALTELGLAELAVGPNRARHTLLDAAVTALSLGRLDLCARAGVGLVDSEHTERALEPDTQAVLETLLDKTDALQDLGPDPHRSGLLLGRLLSRAVRRNLRVPASSLVGEATATMGVELRRREGPARLAERMILARELGDLARQTADSGAQRLAAHHLASTAALLGLDEECSEAVAILAKAVPDGVTTGVERAVFERMVAVAVREGRSADAQHVAQHVALLRGGGAPPASAEWAALLAPRVMERQLLVDRWLHGLTRAGRTAMESSPPHDAGPVDSCLADLLDGRRGRAQLRIRSLTLGVESLPEGDQWTHAMGVLALCVVQLGDAVAAERLLVKGAPFAGLWCGIGYRSDIAPMSFHLGRLAMLLGSWRDAERHLRTALHQLAGVRARPWLALAQHDLAATLERRVQTTSADPFTRSRTPA